MLDTVWEFFRHSREADFVIVNCDPALAMKLAALYMLFPSRKRPILAHDFVLRRPMTLRAKFLLPVKRFLLSRIDHFSLYFRDLRGYERYYGIAPPRTTYVPFKPNIRYRYSYNVTAEGEYVLCFGRSERDYDTFFDAMEKLPDLPGAIPPPDFASLKRHASRFSRPLDRLPANIRILKDDRSAESLIRIVERAKLVVLPILGSRIAPSGIGTYLNAMLMGKCVITTHGVATTDVLLNGEALLVPPEDPDALADAIRRAWEDRDLRERTAGAGRRYAESCGGEPELRQRVLECALERFGVKTH